MRYDCPISRMVNMLLPTLTIYNNIYPQTSSGYTTDRDPSNIQPLSHI